MSGEDWNETLFDGFPEPVLLLREEKVAYCNRAAEGHFPGVRVGDDGEGAPALDFRFQRHVIPSSFNQRISVNRMPPPQARPLPEPRGRRRTAPVKGSSESVP